MLMIPSDVGIKGIGGGISIAEASVGPGKPAQVPSGLWIGSADSGSKIEGANGVGVGVANGFGVANGPICSADREQPVKAINKQRRKVYSLGETDNCTLPIETYVLFE
jgi:hypothetical protein